MAIQKLSARKLESAKPGQTLVDQQNENLELDVSASGKRSWFVRYSCKVMKDGKLVSSRFRKKVGSYPAMSHDEAIEIRNQYMRWIAAGIDPATRINKVTPEKADKNGPLTFGEY
ncbi:MAG: Arm DNA-binding domain-containing protein, partial [Pseudomonadota bacterium]